jgi:hypothetical protein
MEPLPPEWGEGTELQVEVVPDTPYLQSRAERSGQWIQEVEEAAALIDPETDQQLQKAIAEIRRHATEQARREMGLPG